MDKNHKLFGFLFVVLAAAAYYYSLKHTPPRPNPVAVAQAEAPTPPPAPAQEAITGPGPLPEFAAATPDQAGAHETSLGNSFIRVDFTDFGGAVRDVAFHKYRHLLDDPSPEIFNGHHKDPMLAFVGVPGLDQTVRYQIVSQTEREIVFRAVVGGQLEVTRKYIIPPDEVGDTDPYQLRLETTFRNLSDKEIEPMVLSVALGTAAPVSLTDRGTQLTTGFHSGSSQTFIARARLEGSRGLLGLGLGAHPPLSDIASPGPMDWAAVSNQFFSSILTPDPIDDTARQAWIAKRADVLVKAGEKPDQAAAHAASEYEAGFNSASITGLVTRRVKLLTQLPDTDNSAYGVTADAQFILPPIPAHGQVLLAGNLYVGPKEYHRLANTDVFKANQERVVLQMGAFLRFFSASLLTLMTWMHGVTSNWGVAIVLTTLLLKVVFLPFTLAASRSARRMQKIQPEMKAIREKYKDNPQKQQTATMALFKEHKVNPLGGCLPMLITLPFFWGFFGMLSNVAELRFAPFLWAHDLAAPDTVGHIFGFPINLLALLLGLTMFLQMHFTPQPSVDNSQAVMMKFTPVIFMLICYTYPCALALYSSTNALFSIGQQIVVNRMKDTVGDAADKAATGRVAKNVTPRRRK